MNLIGFRRKANFSNDIYQLCQNAKSSFSYRGLVPWNSFPAFLFNLNPAVVISFKNTDDNHFVGIHEKRYLNVFLLLISYSDYCYYKIIFSFNQSKYIICNYFPLPVDSFTVEKKSFLFVVVFVNIPTVQASFSD